MKILIIDNYDSFTFNLYQCIGDIIESGEQGGVSKDTLSVVRNNDITLEAIEDLKPTHIVVSPGPGTPEDKRYFGVCKDVILNLGDKIPILGVCLGMQGIAYAFGAKIVRAPTPMHGKVSYLSHAGEGVFRTLPQGIEVMRYHSLMIDEDSIPDCLEVTAIVPSAIGEDDGQKIIMGIRHREFPIEGIQFHPESFATEGSRVLLSNFIYPTEASSELAAINNEYEVVMAS